MLNTSTTVLTRRGFAGVLAALPLAVASARTRAFAAPRLLIAQPTISDGIAKHFWVQGVGGQTPQPYGTFFLQANQPNPFTPTGVYTPVTWSAAGYTGLALPQPGTQLGIYNTRAQSAFAHTIAQMAGNAVGGFIYSPDLINGSASNNNGTAGMKQMICPSFQFPLGAPVFPFANGNNGIAASLDFQVPYATAAGIANVSSSYASSDFLLVHKTTGARVSYSVKLFALGANPTHDSTNYDVPTGSAIAAAVAATWSRYLTLGSGSAQMSGTTWSGWRTFSFTITTANAAAALTDIDTAMPGFLPSTNPADYILSTWHGNFETHYTAQQPATLGWSLANFQASLI